jgi:hypothetical protein
MLFIAIGGLLAFGIAAAMIVANRVKRTDDLRLNAAPTLYPDPPHDEDLSTET